MFVVIFEFVIGCIRDFFCAMLFLNVFKQGEKKLFFCSQYLFGFDYFLSGFGLSFSKEQQGQRNDENNKKENNNEVHKVEWCF